MVRKKAFALIPREHLCRAWCQCGKVRNEKQHYIRDKDQRSFYLAEALRLCHGVPQDAMQRNGYDAEFNIFKKLSFYKHNGIEHFCVDTRICTGVGGLGHMEERESHK